MINIGRAVKAGAEGVASAAIGVVSYGSGLGWPLGVIETGITAYKLGIALPGLMNRGVQQFSEGWNENKGELSFGHWKNLRGLGPLGQDVDDPCETYAGALQKKRDQLSDILDTARTEPIEAAKKAWRWLIDWAI